MSGKEIKRYWMEAEGPIGERVDSDESSVQVVLASDYDSLSDQLEISRAAFAASQEAVYALNKLLSSKPLAKAQPYDPKDVLDGASGKP
jgi:hypothetical protein